jgi:hypothetical protein
MGGNNGLRSAGAQLWHQGTPGVSDALESGDSFWMALSAGDIDGDGFSDLAIGVPDESSPTDPTDAGPTAAGMVHILYGSQQGLRTNGAEHIDGTDANGRFGASVATIDRFKETGLGRDGFADLAVGAPGRDSGAGLVSVMNGTEDGLVGGEWTRVDTNTPAPASSRFGSALAVGNWGPNGRQNLAVGAPGESVGGNASAGKVYIFIEGTEFTQATPDVQNEPQVGDRFGASLAAGDFGGDGRDDLAVGVLGETSGSADDAGLVTVLPGTSEGLTARNSEILFQDQDGVPNTSEEDDFFGASLDSANFGRGPEDDLAIGVPFEGLVGKTNVGMVDVAYGSPGGLSAHKAQSWNQNIDGVLDSVGENEVFGTALGSGRFGNGGASDLAIGVPFESFPGESSEGAVSVLYSRSNGLRARGDQLWNRSDPGIPGGPDPLEVFGGVLYSTGESILNQLF